MRRVLDAALIDDRTERLRAIVDVSRSSTISSSGTGRRTETAAQGWELRG